MFGARYGMYPFIDSISTSYRKTLEDVLENKGYKGDALEGWAGAVE